MISFARNVEVLLLLWQYWVLFTANETCWLFSSYVFWALTMQYGFIHSCGDRAKSMHYIFITVCLYSYKITFFFCCCQTSMSCWLISCENHVLILLFYSTVFGMSASFILHFFVVMITVIPVICFSA